VKTLNKVFELVTGISQWAFWVLIVLALIIYAIFGESFITIIAAYIAASQLAIAIISLTGLVLSSCSNNNLNKNHNQ